MKGTLLRRGGLKNELFKSSSHFAACHCMHSYLTRTFLMGRLAAKMYVGGVVSCHVNFDPNGFEAEAAESCVQW